MGFKDCGLGMVHGSCTVMLTMVAVEASITCRVEARRITVNGVCFILIGLVVGVTVVQY